MKSIPYTRFEDRDLRTIAHIAAIARNDTVHGGCRALVLAEKAERMGSKNGLVSVVSDVYALSTGQPSREHEGWECPECGQPHLGQQAARECCQNAEWRV